MPLLDRMLAAPGERPAIFADARPSGASRTLRAAMRGGWIGTPGPRDRRRAKAKVTPALRLAAEAPRIELMGLELGDCVHARVLDVARRRTAGDVARIAVLRRAFARGRVRAVVLAYDLDPDARLVTVVARDAGIPTVVLQHGAVLLPRPLSDCAVADQVGMWSEAVAPPAAREGARVHVVGYPMPHERPPTRALEPSRERPTVVVIGQGNVGVDMFTFNRGNVVLRAVLAITGHLPGPQLPAKAHPPQQIQHRLVVHHLRRRR